MKDWTQTERKAALEKAEQEGVDLLVVGGGITGAGILRDAASRGLRALLVEQDDFGSGTSGRSSKLVHGGLRYIGEGQLSLTRESCRERDRLYQLNPNLIKPLPFLFPVYDFNRMSMWKGRVMMFLYSALSNFSPLSRYNILKFKEVSKFSTDLRQIGLCGAWQYNDACVDDVRLVIETLKSARNLGAEAINHAELLQILHREDGRVSGGCVRDRLTGRDIPVQAQVVINATGAGIERFHDANGKNSHPKLRSAKGVHLVIPRDRIKIAAAFSFENVDGRYLFILPWDDVTIMGTTDTFVNHAEDPVVASDDVIYLIDAVNQIFPSVHLDVADLCSVYAGTRQLVDRGGNHAKPSSVSREERIYKDASGLISVAGGKLTTHRLIAERAVNQSLAFLTKERRQTIRPSRTAKLPLRLDPFNRTRLVEDLCSRFRIERWRVEHLARSYGADAERLLAESPAELRRPIGDSRYLFAEIPWSLRTECPLTLCDLLERRIRLALFAKGQGLPQLEQVGKIVGAAAGWSDERIQTECKAYMDAVTCKYQVNPRSIHSDL